MDNFPGETMRLGGGGLPQGLHQQPIVVVGGVCKSPSSSPLPSPSSSSVPSRYEAQKRRDWNTFGQYLKNHRPPLELGHCSGAHVLEFLRYLDQFGKTKIHTPACPFFGHPQPPAPCPCPLRQAWGSLDALVGRLRAAFEENGGQPESNPFGARAVHLYLREVRHLQAKARGIAYDKKKRKRPSTKQPEQHQQSPAHAPYDTEVDSHPSPSSSLQQHHNNPIPPSPSLLLNNMQHKHHLHYGNHLHYDDDNERYNHLHPPPPPPPFASSQQLPTADYTYHSSLLPYGTF